MVLIRCRSDSGKRFDPEDLRSRLLEQFPEATFDSEEQTSKRLRLMRALPVAEKPPKYVLDKTASDGQEYGPTYAFEFHSNCVRVHGNVRSVDAVFFMNDMPSQECWRRMLEFAESIEGGVIEIDKEERGRR